MPAKKMTKGEVKIMSKPKYVFVALIGMIMLLISCSTGVRSSVASPALFENCPLKVQGNSPLPTPESSPPSASQSRLLVFISDLHMGVGKDRSGRWHKYEAFRWQKEFELFLQEINSRGRGETDLVLDGDTFELWQSIEDDCLTGTKTWVVRNLRHLIGSSE